MADELKSITCPECKNVIDLDMKREYIVGDIVECPYCGSELEISRVTPDGLEVVLVVAEK